MKPKYKLGDKLICKNGYTSSKLADKENYGGAGYEKCRIFIVRKITKADDERAIYWPKRIDKNDNMSGVHEKAVELFEKKPRRILL